MQVERADTLTLNFSALDDSVAEVLQSKTGYAFQKSANTTQNVERLSVSVDASGKRVSNAQATCPSDGDNTSKEVLIPNDVSIPHGEDTKGRATGH